MCRRQVLSRKLKQQPRHYQRQRERQKSKISKTTILNSFLYISLPSLPDHDVKLPNCKFSAWGGRESHFSAGMI